MQIVTLVFSETEVSIEGPIYKFDYVAIFSSSTAEFIGQTIILFLVNRGRVYAQSVLYLLGGIMVTGLCLMAETGTAERSTLIILAFLGRMVRCFVESQFLNVCTQIPTHDRLLLYSA